MLVKNIQSHACCSRFLQAALLSILVQSMFVLEIALGAVSTLRYMSCLQLARPVLADVFERRHREAKRDDYQFSVLDNWVCDATTSGGSARYINHSCDPNCRTRVMKVGSEYRIGIFSIRDIKEGEELSYDYMVRVVLHVVTLSFWL